MRATLELLEQDLRDQREQDAELVGQKARATGPRLRRRFAPQVQLIEVVSRYSPIRDPIEEVLTEHRWKIGPPNPAMREEVHPQQRERRLPPGAAGAGTWSPRRPRSGGSQEVTLVFLISADRVPFVLKT